MGQTPAPLLVLPLLLRPGALPVSPSPPDPPLQPPPHAAPPSRLLTRDPSCLPPPGLHLGYLPGPSSRSSARAPHSLGHFS